MHELLVKIVLSHLLGDFVFQSDKMVNSIGTKKFKSPYLYLHAMIHLGLMLIITRFERAYIFPICILALSHLVIDCFTKIIIVKKIKEIYNLILDQSLHALSILIFINCLFDVNIIWEVIFSKNNYLLFSTMIVLLSACSIAISKTMSLFDYNLPNKGLEDAGKVIGILERLFIFYFVVSGFWEGIGFLLAAKSIFRFGELKDGKDVKHTEYILIGTLLSFGLAILVAVIYLKIKAIIL